jgi:hypothetical protein
MRMMAFKLCKSMGKVAGAGGIEPPYGGIKIPWFLQFIPKHSRRSTVYPGATCQMLAGELSNPKTRRVPECSRKIWRKG